MDLDELEKRIDDNTKKLEILTELIEHNSGKISKNSEKIQHNSGALDLLHTIKSNSDKYFVIWIITFVAFLGSLGYIVYLLNDISQVTTQEVEQENDIGDNNYIGRDGDING